MKTALKQFALFLLVISLTACGAEAPANHPANDTQGTPTVSLASQTRSATASPTATSAPQSTGACANPYFPVSKGAAWTYIDKSVAGGTSHTNTITSTITQVREDGFSVEIDNGESKSTQEWHCAPDGLTALQFDVSGLVESGVQIATSDVQGFSLPKNIQPGDQWTYSVEFQGLTPIPEGFDAETSGTISATAQALTIESVSVPAGTFKAMKVEIISTFMFTVSAQGLQIPSTAGGKSTVWYAPGIGIVKIVESSEVLGIPLPNSTKVLKSYSIP